MSNPTKKLQQKAPASQESKAEDSMCILMRTAKMIKCFAENKISKDKQFSKLSGPRLGVLFAVNETGTIRMGDLATKLMVAPRTVTDLVDGLERDGFLKRIPDPSDRRAMLLELTSNAKTNFSKMTILRKTFVEEIFSILNVNEQCQLIALLTKLTEGPLRSLVQEATKEASQDDKSFCSSD